MTYYVASGARRVYGKCTDQMTS